MQQRLWYYTHLAAQRNLDCTRRWPPGTIITLDARVVSTLDAPNTELTFTLPSGVVPVQGAPQQTVDLVAHQPYPFTLDVQITKAGTHKVIAHADVRSRDGRFGSRETIWLDADNSQTTARTEEPYNGRSPTRQPLVQQTATP
jgi:hypothetical protein